MRKEKKNKSKGKKREHVNIRLSVQHKNRLACLVGRQQRHHFNGIVGQIHHSHRLLSEAKQLGEKDLV